MSRALACALLAGLLAIPLGAHAAATDIYTYRGADREQRLLAGARKEGSVVVYTSLSLKDSTPITEAFEKKYGVQVSLLRLPSEQLVQRAIRESKGRRSSADVFETNGPEMELLYRSKLLAKFWSPVFKDLPDSAFPPHRHYVADRFNFFVMAYNTNLVKPSELPKRYQDLLAPQWAGEIGIEAGDVDWFAAVLKSMGETKGRAFFRKLAATRPQIRHGHTFMAELVAAGAIPLTVTAYNHSVERLKGKGAPIDWRPLPPTFGRPNAVGVASNAAHPHAALLFAEFLLSPEGQELIKKRKRVPASRAVRSPLNDFEYQAIDPVIVLDEADKWLPLWEQLFLKQG